MKKKTTIIAVTFFALTILTTVAYGLGEKAHNADSVSRNYDAMLLIY